MKQYYEAHLDADGNVVHFYTQDTEIDHETISGDPRVVNIELGEIEHSRDNHIHASELRSLSNGKSSRLSFAMNGVSVSKYSRQPAPPIPPPSPEQIREEVRASVREKYKASPPDSIDERLRAMEIIMGFRDPEGKDYEAADIARPAAGR